MTTGFVLGLEQYDLTAMAWEASTEGVELLDVLQTSKWDLGPF
jgi:hypothetical protein